MSCIQKFGICLYIFPLFGCISDVTRQKLKSSEESLLKYVYSCEVLSAKHVICFYHFLTLMSVHNLTVISFGVLHLNSKLSVALRHILFSPAGFAVCLPTTIGFVLLASGNYPGRDVWQSSGLCSPKEHRK